MLKSYTSNMNTKFAFARTWKILKILSRIFFYGTDVFLYAFIIFLEIANATDWWKMKFRRRHRFDFLWRSAQQHQTCSCRCINRSSSVQTTHTHQYLSNVSHSQRALTAVRERSAVRARTLGLMKHWATAVWVFSLVCSWTERPADASHS